MYKVYIFKKMRAYIPNLDEFELNYYSDRFNTLYETITSWEDTRALTRKRVRLLDIALELGRKHQRMLASATTGKEIREKRNKVGIMMRELTEIRTDPELQIVPDPTDLEGKL